MTSTDISSKCFENVWKSFRKCIILSHVFKFLARFEIISVERFYRKCTTYNVFEIITPYIRMLDSDWLIALIFFFTNSGLALWICRIFTSCRCICIRFNLFFMVFAKSYFPFLPFTETLVNKFVKRYISCAL